jgi:hypothetical protein
VLCVCNKRINPKERKTETKETMLLMMPFGKQTNLHKTIREETEQTTETCIDSTATVAAAAANDPRQQQQMKTSSTSTADSGSSGSRSTEKCAATTSVEDKDQLKTKTKKKKKKHRHDDAADGLKGVAAAKEEDEELDDEEVAVGAAYASGDETSQQQQQQPPRMTSVDDSTILPEWYVISYNLVIFVVLYGHKLSHSLTRSLIVFPIPLFVGLFSAFLSVIAGIRRQKTMLSVHGHVRITVTVVMNGSGHSSTGTLLCMPRHRRSTKSLKSSQSSSLRSVRTANTVVSSKRTFTVAGGSKSVTKKQETKSVRFEMV